VRCGNAKRLPRILVVLNRWFCQQCITWDCGIVAFAVSGRWRYWESPACRPLNGGRGKESIKFASFAPLRALPFHPFEQTSGKWLAPRFQFTDFRGRNRWPHIVIARVCWYEYRGRRRLNSTNIIARRKKSWGFVKITTCSKYEWSSKWSDTSWVWVIWSKLG
jgi:hypothetical protein